MRNIIIMDIDGTLVNSQRIITNKTKESLLRIQRKGSVLTLASGRPYKGLIGLAKELEMDKYGGYLICYNGSQVRNAKTSEILYNNVLSMKEAKAVLKHMKKFDVIPMIDKDNYMLVEDVYKGILHELNNRNIIQYEAKGNGFLLKEVDDLAELEFSPNKILTAAEPSYLKQNYKAMKKPFENILNCSFTSPFYFEFTPKGIDKGNALRAIFEKSDDIKLIAFGDAQNDISMLKYADIGIAMQNASKELKMAADYITLSNNEDGIAHALKQLGIDKD